MKIGGYHVFIEKSKWVERGRLGVRHFYNTFVNELETFLQTPYHPRYAQGWRQKHLKRIRMADGGADVRAYVKLYESAKMLLVVAVVGRAAIKRDERSGALDFRFMDYLEKHVDFLPDRFEDLPQPKEFVPKPEKPVYSTGPFAEEVENPVPAMASMSEPETEDRSAVFGWPLDEQEAMGYIASSFGAKPYLVQVLHLVQSKPNEDRILVPPPEGSEMWEKTQIKAMQGDITRTLRAHNYKYSVRYDDASRKFLLVVPEKVKLYCFGRGASGRPSLAGV